MLLNKVVPDLREWYAKAAVDGNWSPAVLLHQVETKLHERHAGSTHNSPATMPPERASLAAQAQVRRGKTDGLVPGQALPRVMGQRAGHERARSGRFLPAMLKPAAIPAP